MSAIKTWLPTMFTFTNLSMGFLALMMLYVGRENLGLSFIILAMFLDGVDGRLARKFNVSGKVGKELDSLSDTISFGVVPAYFFGMNFGTVGAVNFIFPLIFLIFACYRVAKYNYEFEEGSSDKIFYGLPLPVAGIIIAFISSYDLLSLYAGVIVLLALSILMVTEIPYPSFKNFRPKNIFQGMLFIIFVAVLVTFHYVTAVLYGLYVILGIIIYLLRKS